MEVREIAKPGIDSENDIIQFIADVQEHKRQISLAGYTEVHLFMSTPIAAGILVGGLLDNWKPIKVYHYTKETPPYTYWSVLIDT